LGLKVECGYLKAIKMEADGNDGSDKKSYSLVSGSRAQEQASDGYFNTATHTFGVKGRMLISKGI
jgi:hypothetical protein